MTVIRRSSPVGNLTYAAGAVISSDDFKNRVSVRWAMAVQFNSYAHLRGCSFNRDTNDWLPSFSLKADVLLLLCLA